MEAGGVVDVVEAGEYTYGYCFLWMATRRRLQRLFATLEGLRTFLLPQGC